MILDGLALARRFFAGDASSVGEGAFDSLAGLGNAGRIELDDVIAMNRTMRSRSPHTRWTEIIDAEAPWLSAVPTDLDLLESDDEGWRAAQGDDLVAAALAATVGPGRGMSVATKLLHLKRPRLFPILDRLVAEMLGSGLPDGASAQLRTAVTLTRLIRSEGRRNIEQLRAVRDALSSERQNRSLVRILDAVLWCAHPAAGVAGASRAIEVSLRND